MKRYLLSASLLFLMAIVLAKAITLEAIEPSDTFIVRDIEYQNFDDTARLEIETNQHVDYIIYELEDPCRIIIDPLNTVWCDFEEIVYFEEGLVKSIKFVKGKEVPQGPGQPYYPFDFVTVELKHPYPYILDENEDVITLNIGKITKEKAPQVEPEIKLDLAKKIEEEFVEDVIREKAVLEEAQRETQLREETEKKTAEEARKKVVERKEEAEKEAKEKAKKKEEKKIKLPALGLKKEKEKLDLAKKKLTQEKKEIDTAKDELNKKKSFLESERVKLAKETKVLEKDKKTLEKEERDLQKRKKKFTPRPVKELSEDLILPDYREKILTLEDCVQIAMSNSLSARVAKERVNLAKLKVNESFRELFPEVSLLWDETKGMISDAHYRGRKYGFEFKQPIFHGGEQMYLWEQAKMNLKIAQENLNKEKEEIIFNVSKAYYELAKAENKYNYQSQLLEDALGDFQMVKKEYEFGLISQIDFMNVESAQNTVSHTSLSYENNLSLARLNLNKTMNIDMNSNVKIDSKLILKDKDITLDECIELALKFRPEYKISYLNTEVAELTEKIAKSQTFPQVDIFAKYLKAREALEPVSYPGFGGTNITNERVLGATVSVPWGPNTLEYQKKIAKYAPTVSTFESNTKYDINNFRLKLFDDLARASNIKDASISYKQALDELNKAEQDIHTDVRQALFSFKEAKIKVKNALNNIELYKKELEAARIKKGFDEMSFYDVIQAKIKLYTEKASYTDAVGDYYIAIAQVNKAIGLGGYFN